MDLGQLNTYKTKQNHNTNTKKYSDKILFASLNNGLKCRKPVFMRASGICFIKWLQFGSICGESNSKISDIDADSIVEMIYIDSANEG